MVQIPCTKSGICTIGQFVLGSLYASATSWNQYNLSPSKDGGSRFLKKKPVKSTKLHGVNFHTAVLIFTAAMALNITRGIRHFTFFPLYELHKRTHNGEVVSVRAPAAYHTLFIEFLWNRIFLYIKNFQTSVISVRCCWRLPLDMESNWRYIE